MEASEVNSLDRYKSYIQRRRVGSAPSEGELVARSEPKSDQSEASFAGGFAETYRGFTGYGQSSEKSRPTGTGTDGDIDSTVEETFRDDEKEGASRSSHEQRSQSTNPHRTDPGLYKRLYGQNSKFSRTSTYPSSYHGHGAPNHAEIKDNRATVLAVKIIKQALACFALLGIIVLMQQRSDMEGVLAFVKKHLVENHIDSQSVVAGVETIVQDVSRFLGGSP
jgi:hypothetical protein